MVQQKEMFQISIYFFDVSHFSTVSRWLDLQALGNSAGPVAWAAPPFMEALKDTKVPWGSLKWFPLRPLYIIDCKPGHAA